MSDYDNRLKWQHTNYCDTRIIATHELLWNTIYHDIWDIATCELLQHMSPCGSLSYPPTYMIDCDIRIIVTCGLLRHMSYCNIWVIGYELLWPAGQLSTRLAAFVCSCKSSRRAHHHHREAVSFRPLSVQAVSSSCSRSPANPHRSVERLGMVERLIVGEKIRCLIEVGFGWPFLGRLGS